MRPHVERRVREAVAEGASIIDVGGYSSRPGADEVSPGRSGGAWSWAWRPCGGWLPAWPFRSIRSAARSLPGRSKGSAPSIINDISAGELDPAMPAVAAKYGVPYIAMHMKGDPKTMQSLTDYKRDITAEVVAYFEARVAALLAAGIAREHLVLDPGFGFAKTTEQNYELLAGLHRLCALGYPVLAGLSRKSMIYRVLGVTPAQSLAGTVALGVGVPAPGRRDPARPRRAGSRRYGEDLQRIRTKQRRDMPNEKITGNPAEKPAEKVSENGAEKPAGRRDGRRGRPQGGQQNRSQQGAQRDKQHDSPQNKPQAETQSGPGRQSEVRECPGGEHRGARQSASRGGRSGERQNLRTADSRSGNYGRSGSSRPADGTAVGKPAFNWTWRDYALQLSVVIIGIVVTFAGSGLIERWRVAREVRATMLLVHAELETNRADFMQVWDYQQWEMRACKFLTDNRRDLKRIPSDTLASFDPVYGRIHFFHPRRDAFEVLKNSGLMSSVPDKDFLLAVTQGYAVLADLEENISMYYQLKLTAQNDMSKDFSEKQRERFYTGDMYERWECIFSVPCFAEFMLTAPYYFPEGYIEGLLADVDRSIRAIEAKYKLDKKPTDD